MVTPLGFQKQPIWVNPCWWRDFFFLFFFSPYCKQITSANPDIKKNTCFIRNTCCSRLGSVQRRFVVCLFFSISVYFTNAVQITVVFFFSAWSLFGYHVKTENEEAKPEKKKKKKICDAHLCSGTRQHQSHHCFFFFCSQWNNKPSPMLGVCVCVCVCGCKSWQWWTHRAGALRGKQCHTHLLKNSGLQRLPGRCRDNIDVT